MAGREAAAGDSAGFGQPRREHVRFLDAAEKGLEAAGPELLASSIDLSHSANVDRRASRRSFDRLRGASLVTSERSLQRKLREIETTFQNEVNAARIRAAQARLLEGDAPLTRVALGVGCGSLSSISALFRKLTGEAPSTWRTRMRSDGRR